MAAFLGMFVGSLLDPIMWAVAYLIHLFMIKKPPRVYFIVTVILMTIVRTSMTPRYDNLPSSVIFDGFVFFLSSCVMAAVFAYLIKRNQAKESPPDEDSREGGHPIDTFKSQDESKSQIEK